MTRLNQFCCALFLWLSGSSGGLALDWQTNGPHRSAPLVVPGGGQAGFTLMSAAATGVQFSNSIPLTRHLTNQILLNGSGVAAGDVDGDGWCDLYFCGLDRPNALYRNLGNWTFRDVTAESGTACAGLTSSGAAFVDLDGDGDLDLLVNTYGNGTQVFFNDGHGRFTLVGVLNGRHAGMSLAAGDVDGDGYLDLYIANYRLQALMDMPNTRFNFAVVDGRRVVSRVNGRPVTDPEFANRYHLNSRGGVEEDGEPDVLYHNDRGTGFTEIPFASGAFLDEDGRPLVQPPYDWGLSVTLRDLNQDGLPDIWVCNDFDSPDRVWLNQGQGRFRAAPRLAFRKNSQFSMGIDVADINRDGWDDIFVADMLSRDQQIRMDMQGERPSPTRVGLFDDRPGYMMNTLHLNRGDGTYAEIAQMAGVSASEWSWTPLFLDVDLDGFEDLLISNGQERMARSLDVSEELRRRRTERTLTAQEMFENRKLFPRQNTRKVAFRNRGDLTFQDASDEWRFNFDGVSHGMILVDLDNDGDQDVVVNNLNGPAALLRNDSSAPRLAVRLRGQAPNTRGIGARIRVQGGAVPSQSQEMICGGRYLSSDDSMRVFAAGAADRLLTVEVTWRRGLETVVTGVPANRIVEINEAGAVARAERNARSPKPAVSEPMFLDVSSLLNHTHHEEPYDDFAIQPLLPMRLSQLGPGAAWGDLDGDGWEDLVLGTGSGGNLAAFRNDGHGKFVPSTGPAFAQAVARDQTTLLLERNSAGDVLLLAGAARYEDSQTNGESGFVYNLTRRSAPAALAPQAASTGPMALADVDGDGQLDLFVGGRVTRGRYPEPASSLLLRGGDRFALDAGNTSRLAGIGLASGAVFTDLDGDGNPDLVVACEWGPLRLFHNDHGKLVPWEWVVEVDSAPGSPATMTAGDFTGCWNGVTAGDFDGDGRMDLVLTGWGMNTRYQAHLQKPIELYFGEFNNSGTIELLEAFYDPALGKIVPDRQLDFLAKGMPFLRERFASRRQFGTLSVEEVLGDKWKLARHLQIRELRSLVLLNRGGTFRARPLPPEAQMAPAFGVCVADFDGDGHEDMVLAQNFFAAQPDIPRQDAGRGLWLRGDGRGGFQAVPGQESGLQIYGEQRGAAVADYDHDGRVDLVMTQNGAQTKLYHNLRAKPGLRVRLAGPPGNADGIGAVLRLRTGEQAGPAREIHAGAGYWSQDAPVQVLSMSAAAEPATLVVRWPGGRTTSHALPAGTAEVEAPFSGTTRVIRRAGR